MPLPESSKNFYRSLQRIQLVLMMSGRRLWSRMGADFDRSWLDVAPGLVAITSAAQLAAARQAVGYVPAVLAETGQPDEPDVRIRPQAFAGRASDGRSLPGLLNGAVVKAKEAAPTMPPDMALAKGGAWLDSVLRTAVADAARDTTSAEIIARDNMGYVRQINPPCCSRCAVLAGKWYRFNDIMPRHVSCDCLIIPSAENIAGDFTTNPQALVDRGMVNDLTKGQRQRLDEGADLSKVLNESRDRWRERMAADRRAAGPVDALGRSRPTGWMGGGSNPPPVGTTVHQLMDRLTNRVNAVDGMKSAGIAE